MAEKPETPDEQEAVRIDDLADIRAREVLVGPGPLDIPTITKWTPPEPDPCACPVFAIHRPGVNETPGATGVRLASLPPGNAVLPPLASLYLAPGNYVVSANFTITSNVGGSGMLFAMLGTANQGNLSWTWLRIAASQSQIVHLQCVVTMAAADGPLLLDAYGGTVNYALAAFDIWLTAQKTGTATVQTV